MESWELLFCVICLFVITDFQVQAVSKVNTEFERYLRAINSTTTTPTIEERIIMDNFIMAFLKYSYINNEGTFVNYSDTVENARYGEGQILNVTGLLVHVSSGSDIRDDRACHADILGTQGNPFPTDQPWIALVQRGKCTFEDKVKHVAQKGAIGVIIFNDKPVTSLEKMQIKDKNRNVTAVMTYQEIGQDMASILDQGFEVVASITKGESGDRPIGMLNEASMIFVSISFLAMLIISSVWLIFYYIQRFRYIRSKNQQSRHLCSVTKRAIMKIPTKTGRGIDKDGDNDCCAVCIETYKSSDCIRVLPCKHEFHKNCIDPWLIEHRTCPMCKLDVLKYYGYLVGEPSSTLSPTNERIIDANNHMNNSNFENRNNNNSSISSSDNGSYPLNLIVISRSLPTAVDTTPSSDTRVNVSSSIESSSDAINVTTTSTASRQVTDV